MSIKLINFDELKPRKGIPYHRNHVRRMVAAGSFPKPVPLSSKRIAWIESEIDAWLAAKAAERAAPPSEEASAHACKHRPAGDADLDCGRMNNGLEKSEISAPATPRLGIALRTIPDPAAKHFPSSVSTMDTSAAVVRTQQKGMRHMPVFTDLEIGRAAQVFELTIAESREAANIEDCKDAQRALSLAKLIEGSGFTDPYLIGHLFVPSVRQAMGASDGAHLIVGRSRNHHRAARAKRLENRAAETPVGRPRALK
jgi:prophage regulatory protein